MGTPYWPVKLDSKINWASKILVFASRPDVLQLPSYVALSCSLQYLQRNQRMAEWGAQYPGRVLSLDFDGMSHAANPPPNTINWDKHYMCYVMYPRVGSDASESVRESLLAANGLRERAFGNPVRSTT